jgi:hypothetical protein
LTDEEDAAHGVALPARGAHHLVDRCAFGSPQHLNHLLLLRRALPVGLGLRLLVLHGPPQALDEDVVVATPASVHADLDPAIPQQIGELVTGGPPTPVCLLIDDRSPPKVDRCPETPAPSPGFSDAHRPRRFPYRTRSRRPLPQATCVRRVPPPAIARSSRSCCRNLAVGRRRTDYLSDGCRLVGLRSRGVEQVIVG